VRELIFLGILALVGCESAPRSAQVATTTPIAETPTIPMPAEPPRDSCGAREMQWLVGKPKSAIPVPTEPARRRVACTTCPVTLDYRANRLNIFFDAGTGIIKEVKCG
jgi:hypothetical protein